MKLPFLRLTIKRTNGYSETNDCQEILSPNEFIAQAKNLIPASFDKINSITFEIIRELNDDNLLAGVRVKYKGKEYVTGNRYNGLVELYENYKDGPFYKTVSMKNIEIL